MQIITLPSRDRHLYYNIVRIRLYGVLRKVARLNAAKIVIFSIFASAGLAGLLWKAIKRLNI